MIIIKTNQHTNRERERERERERLTEHLLGHNCSEFSVAEENGRDGMVFAKNLESSSRHSFAEPFRIGGHFFKQSAAACNQFECLQATEIDHKTAAVTHN